MFRLTLGIITAIAFGSFLNALSPTSSAATVLPPSIELTIAHPQPKIISPLVSMKRINTLRTYAQTNGYSNRYGLFADLSHFSGKKRFHIVDFRKDKIIHSGLITHGHCKENKREVRFSNQPGSNCSSEGKYSIGESYVGNFGLAFKLEGLDATNRNALRRYIVMHAHDCVFDSVSSEEICESEGCPTVSPAMLRTTSSLLAKESRPVLLWIYK